MRLICKLFSSGLLCLLLLLIPLTVLAQSLPKPDFCVSASEEAKKVLSSVPKLNRLCLGSEIGCTDIEAARKDLTDGKIANNEINLGLSEWERNCDLQSKLIQRLEVSTETKLADALDNFGEYACTDHLDAENCKNEAENSDLKKLQDAISAGYLVTFLEEPISSEPGTIFSRARVCSTSLVRDIHGNLQKIETNSSLSQSADQSLSRYAIEINSCKTYIVETCRPTAQELNYIDLNRGDAGGGLPVAVYCDRVQVIYGKTGVDLLTNYVGFIYRWAAGLVGVISVLVVLISGIQISAANGDSAKIDEAKERITQSLVALALLFLSGVFLYVINPGFFVSSDVEPQSLPAVENNQEQDDSDAVEVNSDINQAI